ncbi:hypothetical protein CCUS01_08203 [Colletotrichum cuscutae]|uniref:Uncharacterized protein n=1 Tax=Colletotrichum cuscutae TaxID=1209917 RepID=A0AAI9XU18_9PEZI|nr:hypothetical protein CCUS01_08203 [Colletotrichum cuscutae]
MVFVGGGVFCVLPAALLLVLLVAAGFSVLKASLELLACNSVLVFACWYRWVAMTLTYGTRSEILLLKALLVPCCRVGVLRAVDYGGGCWFKIRNLYQARSQPEPPSKPGAMTWLAATTGLAAGASQGPGDPTLVQGIAARETYRALRQKTRRGWEGRQGEGVRLEEAYELPISGGGEGQESEEERDLDTETEREERVEDTGVLIVKDHRAEIERERERERRERQQRCLMTFWFKRSKPRATPRSPLRLQILGASVSTGALYDGTAWERGEMGTPQGDLTELEEAKHTQIDGQAAVRPVEDKVGLGDMKETERERLKRGDEDGNTRGRCHFQSFSFSKTWKSGRVEEYPYVPCISISHFLRWLHPTGSREAVRFAISFESPQYMVCIFWRKGGTGSDAGGPVRRTYGYATYCVGTLPTLLCYLRGPRGNAHQPQLPHDSIQTTYSRGQGHSPLVGAAPRAAAPTRRHHQAPGTLTLRMPSFPYECLESSDLTYLTLGTYLRQSNIDNPNHPPQIPMTASLVRRTQKGLVSINPYDIISISTRGPRQSLASSHSSSYGILGNTPGCTLSSSELENPFGKPILSTNLGRGIWVLCLIIIVDRPFNIVRGTKSTWRANTLVAFSLALRLLAWANFAHLHSASSQRQSGFTHLILVSILQAGQTSGDNCRTCRVNRRQGFALLSQLSCFVRITSPRFLGSQPLRKPTYHRGLTAPHPRRTYSRTEYARTYGPVLVPRISSPANFWCYTRKDRAGSSYGYWRRQALSHPYVLRTRIQSDNKHLTPYLMSRSRFSRRLPLALILCSAPLSLKDLPAQKHLGVLGALGGGGGGVWEMSAPFVANIRLFVPSSAALAPGITSVYREYLNRPYPDAGTAAPFGGRRSDPSFRLAFCRAADPSTTVAFGPIPGRRRPESIRSKVHLKQLGVLGGGLASPKVPQIGLRCVFCGGFSLPRHNDSVPMRLCLTPYLAFIIGTIDATRDTVNHLVKFTMAFPGPSDECFQKNMPLPSQYSDTEAPLMLHVNYPPPPPRTTTEIFSWGSNIARVVEVWLDWLLLRGRAHSRRMSVPCNRDHRQRPCASQVYRPRTLMVEHWLARLVGNPNEVMLSEGRTHRFRGQQIDDVLVLTISERGEMRMMASTLASSRSMDQPMARKLFRSDSIYGYSFRSFIVDATISGNPWRSIPQYRACNVEPERELGVRRQGHCLEKTGQNDASPKISKAPWFLASFRGPSFADPTEYGPCSQNTGQWVMLWGPGSFFFFFFFSFFFLLFSILRFHGPPTAVTALMLGGSTGRLDHSTPNLALAILNTEAIRLPRGEWGSLSPSLIFFLRYAVLGAGRKESYPAPGTFNPIPWSNVITKEAQGDSPPPNPKSLQPRGGTRLFRLPSHRARCASAVLAVSRPQGTHGTSVCHWRAEDILSIRTSTSFIARILGSKKAVETQIDPDW